MLLQEASEIDIRHLNMHDVHAMSEESVPELETLKAGSARKVGMILKAAMVMSP